MKREADIGSDHQLVKAMIKLKKLRSTSEKISPRMRVNIDKISDPREKKDCTVKLQKRFQMLKNLVEDTVDEKWGKYQGL